MEVKQTHRETEMAMRALDRELSELNWVAKSHQQEQEDKLDNMRAKIQICRLQQADIV